MAITRLPDPTYYRREVYGALDTRGRVYVHGNIVLNQAGDADANHSQAERYDPATRSWEVLPQPPRKIYQSAFVIDSSDSYVGIADIVFDLGTQGGNQGSPPTAFRWDSSSRAWSTIPEQPVAGLYSRVGGFFVTPGSGTQLVAATAANPSFTTSPTSSLIDVSGLLLRGPGTTLNVTTGAFGFGTVQCVPIPTNASTFSLDSWYTGTPIPGTGATAGMRFVYASAAGGVIADSNAGSADNNLHTTVANGNLNFGGATHWGLYMGSSPGSLPNGQTLTFHLDMATYVGGSGSGRQLWGLVYNADTSSADYNKRTPVSWTGSSWSIHGQQPDGTGGNQGYPATFSPTNPYAFGAGQPSMGPPVRNGRVYLGIVGTGFGFTVYNYFTDTWSLTSAPPVNVSRNYMTWDGGRYIYFGPGGGSAGAYWRYDLDADTYTQLASFPGIMPDGSTVRSFQGVLAAPTYCAVVGAISTALNGFNNIWLYDVANNTWTITADQTTPIPDSAFPTGAPRAPLILKDSVGPGWYFVQGSGPLFVSNGTKIVEYWTADLGVTTGTLVYDEPPLSLITSQPSSVQSSATTMGNRATMATAGNIQGVRTWNTDGLPSHQMGIWVNGVLKYSLTTSGEQLLHWKDVPVPPIPCAVGDVVQIGKLIPSGTTLKIGDLNQTCSPCLQLVIDPSAPGGAIARVPLPYNGCSFTAAGGTLTYPNTPVGTGVDFFDNFYYDGPCGGELPGQGEFTMALGLGGSMALDLNGVITFGLGLGAGRLTHEGEITFGIGLGSGYVRTRNPFGAVIG